MKVFFRKILIIFLWGIILFFIFKYDNVGNNGKITIQVKKGMDIVDVARLLYEKGIIKDKETFITLGGITGIDKKIKTGKYVFNKNMRELSVLRILEKGGKYIIITIPEGIRLKEIAKIVYRKTGIDTILFLSTVNQPEFLRKWNIKGNIAEGYLFPETYYFSGEESAAEIADRMVEEFYKVWDSLLFMVDSLPSLVDTYGIVIMASLIESETSYDEEKPIIAGVYYNRLRKGWKLQCDPTILYAIEKRQKVLYKDLRVNSPYNTYKYKGLPPTPICSPGRSSLLSAMKPQETDYMYFVADGNRHIFSKTLKEHNKNIRSIRAKNNMR